MKPTSSSKSALAVSRQPAAARKTLRPKWTGFATKTSRRRKSCASLNFGIKRTSDDQKTPRSRPTVSLFRKDLVLRSNVRKSRPCVDRLILQPYDFFDQSDDASSCVAVCGSLREACPRVDAQATTFQGPLLHNLPIELRLQTLDYLKPDEWATLERVNRSTEILIRQKYNDVVGLDLAQDYLKPWSKLKFKRRLLKPNMYKLIPFLGSRFKSLETLTFCDCNLQIDCSSGVSIFQALGSALPQLKELHLINKINYRNGGDYVDIRRSSRSNSLIVDQNALSGLAKGQYANLSLLDVDGCIHVGYNAMEFQISHENLPKLQRLLFRRCSGLLSFAESFLQNGRLIEMNFEKFFNYSWLNVFPLINLFQSPCSQSVHELNCVKVEFFDFHGLSPVESVFQLPNLKIVELGQETCWPQWSPSLGDDMLIKCVDLEVLIIVDASFLTRNLLQAICDYCPKITSLCLSGRRMSIDYKIIESLQKLTDLNVADSDVTDEIIDGFARKFKNVIFFAENGLYKTSTAQSDEQLTQLNIRGCKLLTNESLRSLASYGLKLECLYLRRRSRKIDENGIQAVLDGCSNLKKLETTFNLAQKLRLPSRLDFEILNVTSE